MKNLPRPFLAPNNCGRASRPRLRFVECSTSGQRIVL
jgi:hypothetical protein